MNIINTFQSLRENEKVTDADQNTVLIVEDDGTHRTLMDKILRECRFQTELAENGIVALSRIDQGQHFDLVLMDWDMPELNGLETTKAIRIREVKEKKAQRMPIIAFTANRQPGDREKCLAAGMDAYLPKDVWMPKWRNTLIDNLHGLIAGSFDLHDFETEKSLESALPETYDLDAFDMSALEQSAMLLKNELAIAIDEFLEDAAAYINDIRKGLEEGNAEKAARGSHPLKSNSKGLGLIAVSQIAEAINIAAQRKNLAQVATLVPQLQDAMCRSEKKLRKFIQRVGY